MKTLFRIGLCACIFLGASVSADVVDAEAGGFTTRSETTIDASVDTVWQAAIDDVGLWWNDEHTVSGDASRLSIAAIPQGCFCEQLGLGAGVVHMSVSMVSPRVVIRLTGGLGPLGLMGVNGNMTWEFAAVDAGTNVKFTYAVGGYVAGGLQDLAAPVDEVLQEALSRLKLQVETGSPVGIEID